jgi:hypothetical protein
MVSNHRRGNVADAIRAGALKVGIRPEKTNVKALR